MSFGVPSAESLAQSQQELGSFSILLGASLHAAALKGGHLLAVQISFLDPCSALHAPCRSPFSKNPSYQRTSAL